ncbi:hypothetical protein BSKO_12146 [Bryopsis sp. KO-2023]|nr:hypothetical protein BSKO_12146 [Bryopsis sp. KO-2023]
MQTRAVCLAALLLFSLSWVEATPPSASSGGEDNEKTAEDPPVPDSGNHGDSGRSVDEGIDSTEAPEGPASNRNPEIPSFASVLDFSGWQYRETDERTEPANDQFKIQSEEGAESSLLGGELTVDVAEYGSDSSKSTDDGEGENSGGVTDSEREHSPGKKDSEVKGSPESESGDDSSPEQSNPTQKGKGAEENQNQDAHEEASKETQGGKEGQQPKESAGDWSGQEENVAKSDKVGSGNHKQASKDSENTKAGEEKDWSHQGDPSMDIEAKEDTTTTTEKEGGEATKEKSRHSTTEWHDDGGSKDKSSAKGGEHSTGATHASEPTQSGAVKSEPANNVGSRFSNFFSRLSGGSTHSSDHPPNSFEPKPSPRRASIESANLGRKGGGHSGNSGIKYSSLDHNGSNQADHSGTGHGGSGNGPIFSIPNRASSVDANSFRRSRVNGLHP